MFVKKNPMFLDVGVFKNADPTRGNNKLNHIYSGIDEIIAYIHNHIDEPFSLSWLADQAAYSPFHFSRVFKQKTGLSPHYYVASLKMQRAKDLLLNTDLTVRDIGMEIG
ncbi:AraC family transcriptional regulator [Pseudogracilibacillus sp. SO30301A]|uniref:AraC family transcriptional regulator n=1 Tax=Pseudogracilibacillus sp. SO30301A TaxID=3098291 RepID=UPI003FA6C83B